jgi:hypothetical protein
MCEGDSDHLLPCISLLDPFLFLKAIMACGAIQDQETQGLCVTGDNPFVWIAVIFEFSMCQKLKRLIH